MKKEEYKVRVMVDFDDGYKVSKVILTIMKSAELRESVEVDYS